MHIILPRLLAGSVAIVVVFCASISHSTAQEGEIPGEVLPGGNSTESGDVLGDANSDALSEGEAETGEPAAQLALEQEQLQARFERFKAMLLERADFERAENPERAELLERVVALGNERLIARQLEQLSGLVREQQYGRAINNQQVVTDDMQMLLELLLTENRPNSNRDQQERIKQYLRDLERIIAMQQVVETQARNTQDPDRLARSEEQAAERARELADRIAENEGGFPASQDPSSGEGQNEGQGEASDQQGEAGDHQESGASEEEGTQSETQSEEGESQEGSETESENQESDSSAQNQGESGSPSDGQQSESQGQGESDSQQGSPSQGQQSQGQGQQSQDQGESGDQGESQQQEQAQNDFPGRQRIMEAEQRMREAQRKLEEANRRGAEEEAAEASRLLRDAQAELEQILQQLREEEIERMLALLESRFRAMLEMQVRVYEGTIRLAQVPESRRTRETAVQAGRLSFEEKKIVVEAEKALGLLREEGSSAAFPEAVEQMLLDMNQVSDRLSRTLIDRTTQGIEEDIIASLEEMIDALQKAQRDMEQQKQQQASQPGESGDQPLVDQIAELKMIRALHERVHKRTERYSMLLEDDEDAVGQAEDAELREAIQRLADRQERIRETVRDILLERNQ